MREQRNGEPCRLRQLDAGQRKFFDALYLHARSANDFLGSHSQFFETAHGVIRQYDDLAIDIARNMAHQWSADR